MKPQVKESEKSRILTTRDYLLFTVPDRKVSNRFLQTVIESIEKKDLSKDYAILIDVNYKILDGIYRFLALRQLGKSIYYKVAEVTTEVDAVRAKHIHRNMSIHDICKTFSDLPAYNQILVFAETYDISLLDVLVSTENCESPHNGRVSKKFLSTGELPTSDEHELHQRIQDVLSIYDYIQSFGFNCNYLDAYDKYREDIDHVEYLHEMSMEELIGGRLREPNYYKILEQLPPLTPLERFKLQYGNDLIILSKNYEKLVQYTETPINWESGLDLIESTRWFIESMFKDNHPSLDVDNDDMRYKEDRAADVLKYVRIADILGFRIKPHEQITKAKKILHLN